MSSLHNGHAAAVKPRLICWDKLQLQLAALPTTFRALLGQELQSGAVALTSATPRQAAALTLVPMAFFRTVTAATALETAAMRRGTLTVEEVHAARLRNRRRTDVAIDRALVEIGLDRVLAALDRLTRPATNGAANGHATDHANDNDTGAAMSVLQLAL
jgi:hypothetical protein